MKKIESKEIEVCDICGGEDTLLHSCLVCEKEFCTYCRAGIRENSYFNRDEVCKICIEKPAVRDVQEAFRAVYWGLQKREREAFGKCNVK